MQDNLTIFGSADDRTIQQIRNCMDVEAGARAVLCADNHLGYSRPIGGVVAYREHIRPSGVGYDIMTKGDVLAAHDSTIRVVHRLRPIGVAMAGPDEFDPFKD